MPPAEPPEPIGAGLSWKRFGVCVLVSAALVLALAVLSLPTQRAARPAARRTQCRNNLKQIGLALHNYHDDHGCLPPAYLVDADGLRLHSWRTLILPYLDEHRLYAEIDLLKPWNDPVNAAAGEKCPSSLRCPSASLPDGHTTYMAVAGPRTCFPDKSVGRLGDLPDDPGKTLLVIEASQHQSVHWMSPDDGDRHVQATLLKQTGHAHEGGIQATFADGSVRFLSADLRPEIWFGLLRADDGQPLTDDF